MKPKTIMLIAGEASGDLLAAELVTALRNQFATGPLESNADAQPQQTGLAPRFFGAGGPRMAAHGVELAFDLTVHSVTGFSDVLKHYLKFRRFFLRLYQLALERQPDAIVCVDFSGFNRRFAHAIRRHVSKRVLDSVQAWRPRLVQYVSPQVWASREGRAYQMAKDYDLLLSIFPFEKEWYAQRVPGFPVEFVGNPVVERHMARQANVAPLRERNGGSPPSLLLLPGSRRGELQRHLPVMLAALDRMRSVVPGLTARMILPDELLLGEARRAGLPGDLTVQHGGLAEAMLSSTVAIASTGTVTLECACFGLPTVAIYKTSWSNYQLGKHLIKVDYLAMPNLLANAPVFPEFIQNDATPENIAAAAIDLLSSPGRRSEIRTRLRELVQQLGGSGATRRAAESIHRLVTSR